MAESKDVQNGHLFVFTNVGASGSFKAPDYTKGIVIAPYGTTSGRAPADGYLLFLYTIQKYWTIRIYINDVYVNLAETGSTSSYTLLYPVQKGDVFRVEGQYRAPTSFEKAEVRFYPLHA